MKNILKLFALALLVLLLPGLSLAQQNTLVQTTLAAAVPVPASLTPGQQSLVQLTAAVGITAASLNPTTTINQQNQWILYVDREEMAVVQINGTTVQVLRGWNSTVATAHVAGQMVLYGRANWFYQNDPGASPNTGTGVIGVPCTAATVYVTPWLNVRTGAQWLCSTITGTWVPGFGNPMIASNAVPTTALVIQAGALTPTGPLFHGTTNNAAVTGWNIPVGCNGTAFGGCSFTIIPDTVFTWTAAGNIAVLGTAVVNRALTFTWDATNQRWVPSYV